MDYEYTTIESADEALRDICADRESDSGPESIDEVWNDLVDAVALSCDPAPRAELYRTTGCVDRATGILAGAGGE